MSTTALEDPGVALICKILQAADHGRKMLMTTRVSRPPAREPAIRQRESTHVESSPLESTLTIRVSRGVGTGPTRLAAFDQALRSAGVADFNLVRLSSVIPPKSVVLETDSTHQIRGGHGDLLYCVYSDAYSSTPGEAAWAGVTWAQHESGSGAGLFAEHSGWSERDVERELHHTMDDMIASRAPGYRTHGTMLSSIVCETHPVCAIVLASYRCVSWSDGGVP